MQRRTHVPPGWPPRVHPPDTPDWEATATAWLFDHSPPEFRSYPVLNRHVVVLARFTLLHVEASLSAARRGISTTRDGLADFAPAAVVEAALLAHQREEARLLRLHREVTLVQEALRGRRFVPRL